MLSRQILYDDGKHRVIHLVREDEFDGAVQTNQYVIAHGDSVMMLDPGGAHAFPGVLADIAELVGVGSIKHIFYSHQDPDVCSGVALWLAIADRPRVHISQQWVRFLPHFGVYDKKLVSPIPDGGGRLDMGGGVPVHFIPSHFLHSIGCFSLYDPVSKILFSGDIGASVFPQNASYTETSDFASHLKHMEGFHKRYMVSNTACRKWADMVQRLDVNMIIPQHGAIMKGDAVPRFLSWFKDLRCGVDLIDSIYGKGSHG